MINIEGKCKFSIPAKDAPFGVSYIVVEDGIGPYVQKNYYSGGSNGQMDGWESKGASVSTIYDDVARAINAFPYIKGGLPTEIEANKEYTVTAQIPLDHATNKTLSIKQPTFRVIGIVTEAESGEVLNAKQITVSNPCSGIEGVMDDANQTITVENGTINVAGAENVEIYTLDGRRASNGNLAAGLYIVKAGAKTAKVLVK